MCLVRLRVRSIVGTTKKNSCSERPEGQNRKRKDPVGETEHKNNQTGKGKMMLDNNKRALTITTKIQQQSIETAPTDKRH